MRKKASVEVQFAWVFILIVGSLIMAFFFGLANTMKESGVKAVDAETITHLDALLKGASTNPNSLTFIEGLPNLDMTFSCELDDDDGNMLSPYYKIGSSKRSLSFEPVFAPSNVKVSKFSGFYVWSLIWEHPFRIASASYITSPHTLYYFVSGDELIESLYDDDNELSMPNVTKKLGDVEDIVDENYERIVVVCKVSNDDEAYSCNIELSQDLSDKSIIVGIKPFDGDGYGQIIFTGSENAYYLGREQIFGAIFAADGNTYKCNLKKLFDRMEWVVKVLEAKTSELSELSGRCGSLHSLANNKLTTSLTYLSLLGDQQGILHSTLVSNPLDPQQTLQSLNKDLISESCPRIY